MPGQNGLVPPTGTMWTASIALITVVMAPGVLSLSYNMSSLGWIGGPIAIIIIAMLTTFTAFLQADCRPSSIITTKTRNYTYTDAVKAILGGVQQWVCGIAQQVDLLNQIFNIIFLATTSMSAIKRPDCFYKEGNDADIKCLAIPYMIIFGAIQLVFSQLPEIVRLSWMPIVGVIMCFIYLSIGIGLSIVVASEDKYSHGTLEGGLSVDGVSMKQKIWWMVLAVKDINNLYSYSTILLEIQDTIRSPPSNTKTMKKAIVITISTTTFLFILSSCSGYAAFGIDAPYNLFDGFVFVNPYWLVDIANACIVVQLIGQYQVLCEPIFAIIENWATSYPNIRFFNRAENFPIGEICNIQINYFHLIWRTCFVVLTIVVSMNFPLFSDILNLLESPAFWLTTIYFPIMMYISQTKLNRCSTKWTMLHLLNILYLGISIVIFYVSMHTFLS